jgi:ribose-phosphate pyrophosphokinase
MTARDEIMVFAGNSNLPLANDICAYLGTKLGEASVRRFSDGECLVDIRENVRGSDVFVVQSTSSPGNDHLMELLLMLDALRRASAKRITAVVPYYGYSRQDRKVSPRVPISAKLVADLITTAGAERLLTVDLHAGQIQGFFNIPVDNLFATPVLLPYMRERAVDETLNIVAPDAGGVERARAFAKRLEADLSIIDKRRAGPNEVAEMRIIGDVEDRVAVIVDDIVDTAGTLVTAADAIRSAGARSVVACCTHAVLSGAAIERIQKSALEELVVTDTIRVGPEALATGKVRVRSVAKLMGEAVKRIHDEESISNLFV